MHNANISPERPKPVARKTSVKSLKPRPASRTRHTNNIDVDHESVDQHNDSIETDDYSDLGVIVETTSHLLDVESDDDDAEMNQTSVSDETESNQSSEASEIQANTPVPAPRRSSRQRRPPQWLNSGEYELLHVMAQTHSNFNQMIINKLTNV